MDKMMLVGRRNLEALIRAIYKDRHHERIKSLFNLGIRGAGLR